MLCHLQAIDVFLLDAKQSLSVRPQTVEEIGEVNQRHTELSRKKPEVCVCVWVGRWKGTVVYLSTASLFLVRAQPGYEAIFLYVELHVCVLELAGQMHR